MGTFTRRRLLAALPAVSCGLAGCLGSETSSSGSSRSTTVGPGRNVPDEQAVTDPPMLVRRGGSERPVIRFGDSGESETDSDTEREASPRRERAQHIQNRVIDDAAAADRLTVESADGSDETDLASFVSETAFDRETLYLETKLVEQCYQLSLCYLSWTSNSVQTDYSRLLRPYDQQCAVETKVFESRLFRLPVALDATEVRGYGSSTSSSRCNRGSRMAPTGSQPPETNSSGSPNGSDPA